MNASDLRLIDLMLAATKEQIMSELTDRIDEVISSFDDARVRVEAAVAELRAEIAELKKTAPTPADLEKLAALDAKVDALDPTKEATLPPE